MGDVGREAARVMLMSQVVRAARDLRDASRNSFTEEPEALDAWDGLNEALTALDDFSTRGVGATEVKPPKKVDDGAGDADCG